MKIKFKSPDPRAGTIVQMDSSRGQHFVDNGSAVLVKEDGSDDELVAAADAREAVKDEKPAPASRSKKAAAASKEA